MMTREANLLGTLSLAVADRIEVTGGAVVGHSSAARAALSALAMFLEKPSIEELSEVLGLSHSATVRTVDRLEGEGFVVRESAPDRRAVAIAITAEGRKAGRSLVAARHAATETLLSGLDDGERARFVGILEKLLARIVALEGKPNRICRLCDPGACGHWDRNCPVTEAARA